MESGIGHRRFSASSDITAPSATGHPVRVTTPSSALPTNTTARTKSLVDLLRQTIAQPLHEFMNFVGVINGSICSSPESSPLDRNHDQNEQCGYQDLVDHKPHGETKGEPDYVAKMTPSASASGPTSLGPPCVHGFHDFGIQAATRLARTNP